MSKVIFISQPMGGRSDDEINAERRRVIEIARQQFGEVDALETLHRISGKGRCGDFCAGLAGCSRMPHRAPVRRGLRHSRDGGVTNGKLLDF